MKSTVRRVAVGVAAFAAVAGLGAGSASAGEITGNGKSTPIDPDGPSGDGSHAASECAFSGLNDEYYRDGALGEPRVQTPAGARRFVGYACNPTFTFPE